MKTYAIYLSDFPGEPLKVRSNSKADARKAARLYIRQWKLDAAILKIEELPA